jgi:hypothetical protein
MTNNILLDRLNPYQMMKLFAYLRSVNAALITVINGFLGKQNKARQNPSRSVPKILPIMHPQNIY